VKIFLRHKPDGMALFIVMVSIFILAFLAGGLAYSMKVETKLAMNANDENDLEWVGRSGIEYARWVLGGQLKTPNEPYDSLNQKWAGGPGGTNDFLADASLTDVELGKGKFSVKIVDAERKFDINLALNNEALLQQALILIGIDASDAPTIIASIQDWIDTDDNTHINGAETEYYQGLNPPYEAKNGPIDDVSELLFIKGITPEIYWGPNSTNHPSAVFQSKTPGQTGLLPVTSVASAGLVDIFTTVSSGRININTASHTGLQLIPGVTDNIATEIIRLRSGPDGADGTEDDTPFRNTGELINAVPNRQLVQQMIPFCTVRSTTFQVQVDAEIGQSKRTYYALLVRNSPTDVQLLNMYWK
jgi:general secretion pathway protein K